MARPGLRDDYGANYFAAFVIDPDGYRLEAYCSASKPALERSGAPAACSMIGRASAEGRGMPSYDSLFNAFVTILVTIDPPGLAPLYLAVTRGMNREERARFRSAPRSSVWRDGPVCRCRRWILSVFGITLPAFRVAGGFLLFFIAFEMVFERRQDRKEKIADVAITKDRSTTSPPFRWRSH